MRTPMRVNPFDTAGACMKDGLTVKDGNYAASDPKALVTAANCMTEKKLPPVVRTSL